MPAAQHWQPVQVIVRSGDGLRKRGFLILSTICYIKEKLSGKKDNICIIAAAAYDHMLPCTWALPIGEKNTALTFEAWFGYALLPLVPKGYTIILDNAAIHRRAILRAMAHAVGVNVLFLPAYSPELAWIELCFGWLKRKLQVVDRTVSQTELAGICLGIFAAMPPAVMQGFVRHCGYAVY